MPSALVGLDFLNKVGEWAQFPDRESGPRDFSPRAWQTYLTVIRQPSYYFSVDELLAMCALAGVNMAVFTQVGQELHNAGHFLQQVP